MPPGTALPYARAPWAFTTGWALTTRASAWELADTLGLPVLLVVQPKGASLTLAAELQGLLQFRTPSHIVGILLNDCSESLYKTLRPMLEARPACRWWAICPICRDAPLRAATSG